MDTRGLEQRRVGRFQLLRMLSREGKVPCIYKGEYRTEHETVKDVAIYVFKNDPINVTDFERTFLAQSELVRNLKHPCIAEFFDSTCGNPDYVYLVRDFVEGATLQDYLTTLQSGHMELELAIAIVTQVADALHHAHNQGIWHLDIRPSHILLVERAPRQVLLAGFGLAEIMNAYDPKTLNDSVPHYGAYSYMAPEQFTPDPVTSEQPMSKELELERRKQEVGPWTDIYSLACVLYEMLVGSSPFGLLTNAQDAVGIDVKQRRPDMRRVDAVCRHEGVDPRTLRSVIDTLSKAMQFNPTDRHHTPREFADALGWTLPTVSHPLTRSARAKDKGEVSALDDTSISLAPRLTLPTKEKLS